MTAGGDIPRKDPLSARREHTPRVVVGRLTEQMRHHHARTQEGRNGVGCVRLRFDQAGLQGVSQFIALVGKTHVTSISVLRELRHPADQDVPGCHLRAVESAVPHVRGVLVGFPP